MPDPLTALGAAAASAQFVELAAKALLKTIRFAKDLRKVDRLARVVTELHHAMDDLNRTLTPLELERLRAGKTLRRLWKSVMAVNAEKDVADKLQKVDRLNNEVDRQLGVTGLELQATIADKLDQAGIAARDDKADLIGAISTSSHNLQVKIQEKHVATTNDLAGIASTTRGIHHTVTNTESRAQDIQRTVTDIASVTRGTHQTVADIASTTQGVYQTVTEFRGNVTAIDMGMSHLAEDTATIREDLAILADPERPKPLSHQQIEGLILQLRDELVAMSTGQIHKMSVTSQTTSQTISGIDQEAVQESARRQLMRCPSSLAEAAASLRVQRCRCRPFREFTDTSFWGLSFRAEESTEHWPRCRYAKTGARSWAYSARAALTPFLNLTLELAIGATARGTAWSLASPLRFYGTVRRSKSPLFQAFDRLPSSCVSLCAMKNEQGDYVVKDEHGETKDGARFDVIPDLHEYYLWQANLRLILPDYWHEEASQNIFVQWNRDAVKCRLKDLSRQIRHMVQQGTSVGDVDEEGRTIMFSFVSLVLLFEKHLHVLSDPFRDLFNAILDSNLDLTVQTIVDDKKSAALYVDQHRIRFECPLTAWEYFFWLSGLNAMSASRPRNTRVKADISYIFDHVAAYISPAGIPRLNYYEEWEPLLLKDSASPISKWQSCEGRWTMWTASSQKRTAKGTRMIVIAQNSRWN
ncbi:hypothetical protein GE09DRAFT_1192021 [Coniochaeta sp. 2T2.1]|nr:hypothetical protein GE09DRAFT_1192021 [Coniochaeta sp. 2T2.1]